MTYSRIAGTGSYLPERILDNAELEKMVDTSDEWIKSRTGISKRHIAAENETTCDLAEHAARRAIGAASISAAEIDLIIVATTTPDLIFPSVACLLQQRLGIRGTTAFDVQAVCAGFIYALSIADKFMTTHASKTALVVGAETLSRITNWNDRDTCVLFADGAGAVVLKADTTPGITLSLLHADGKYCDLLAVPSGVSKRYHDMLNGNAYITMQGNEVFKYAVNKSEQMIDTIFQSNGIKKESIDWLVPHQANLRIIKAIAKKLDIPIHKVILTIEEHGNTSAASVPLALDTAIRDGRIKRGHKLMLEAFGAGFTWGALLIDY